MENSQAALLTLGFLLFLKGSSALVVTPVTDPVISKVGDNVMLEINPPGDLGAVEWFFSPAKIPVVSWVGSDPVIGAGYENRVTLNTATGSVELRSVNRSDAGVYTFQGTTFTSGRETFNGSVTLRVDGSSALVVTPVTDPVISKVGDNVMLEIKPPGVLGAVEWFFSPAKIPVVSWVGSDPVIGAGYENRVTLNTTTGSVELRSVNLSDAGVYAFQGTTFTSGRETFIGNVTLKVDVSSALVVTPVTDPVISKVGDNVMLEIKPPGDLGAVEWFFSPANIPVVSWAGSDPVIGAGYENRVTLNTTTGSVELRSVNLSDAGVYTFQGNTFTSGRETFIGNVTLKVDVSSALVVTPVTDPVISEAGDNVMLEIKPPGVLGAVEWFFSPANIPVVSWAGSDPVIGAGYENRVTLNTTTGSVELRSVNLSDAGVYTFQGTTFTSGRETFIGNVTLKVDGSSALVDPVISKVGGNVMLEIKPPGVLVGVAWTFSPAGIPVVSWVGSNHEIGAGYENRVTLNTTTGSVELRSVNLSDAGVYTFQGTTLVSGRETFIGNVTLKVYEPVSQPTVRSNVTDPVEFNDTVSLSCTASGSAVSYRWFNGSSVVSDSERIRLSDDNKTLTIARVLRSDDGTLYCYVFNPVSNSTSEPFHLIVSYGPESLTLSISPQKPIYSAGSDLTLSCSAQSSPPAHYQWFFNGAPLNKLGSQLNMAHIQHNQTGNYTCWASNNITLRYAKETREIIVVELITVNVKPSLAQPIANQALNLTCEVLGSQTVSSRLWLKDGQPLSTSDRITLSVGSSVVSFNPVLQSDDGEYQCKASNPVIEVTSPGYILEVNYGPEQVSITAPDSAAEGSSVTFTCSAQSLPPCNYTWYFNGTETAQSSQYKIASVSNADRGSYTCVAWNSVTGRNTSAVKEFIVTDKEEPTGLGSLSLREIAGIGIGILAGVTGVALGMYFSVKLCRNNPHDLKPGPAESSTGSVIYENFEEPRASVMYENTTAIRRAGEAENPDSTYTGLQFPDQSTYNTLNRP
ncbi:hemicentin-1-like isoform X2 [Acipenser ruthenus]|uniref:hemicentin-1-like isoform X2 n=1 Tax=Acipenser ruthenus TaxID=7906 RepID=UPI002742026A|nr:hemicentin-1-like isoform X2 [Acipenser ruthenus]